MARYGVFADSHGLEHIDLIAEAMSKMGVETVYSLGDHAYDLTTPYTLEQAIIAEQQHSQLAQVSLDPNEPGMMEDALSGAYTDNQLMKLKEDLELGIKVSDAAHKKELEYVDNAFKKRGVSLEAIVAGNHDRQEPMQKVFGNRLLNGQKKIIGGYKIIGLSGGGSPFPKSIRRGLYADDILLERRQAEKWAHSLLGEEQIDILLTHLPPTDGKGVFKENAVENIKSFLFRRAEQGKELPKAIFSGHRHGDTKVSYDEELGTIWVQPGSAGLTHNRGAHASFVVVDSDDKTKKVKKVEEYRIYNFGGNRQEVELYATHLIDYNSVVPQVSLHKSGETAYRGNSLNTTVNYFGSDPNAQKSFDVNYEGLSIKEKDARLRLNLSLGQAKAEKVSEEARKIANGELKRYLQKMEKRVLALEDYGKLGKLVHEGLFQQALELSHYTSEEFAEFIEKLRCQGLVNNDKKDKENNLDSIKDVFILHQLGLTQEKITESLTIPNIEVERLPYNLMEKISGQVREHLSRRYQQIALENLEAKDFQAMAELYMPDTVEREWNIPFHDEALNLWAQSYRGLIPTKVMRQQAAYGLKSDYKLTPRTLEDLTDKFGIDLNPDIGKTIPGEIQKRTKKDKDKQQVDGIRQEQLEKIVKDYLDKGNRVFQSPYGSHCLQTEKGYRQIPSRLQKDLNYELVNVLKAFEEKKIVQDARGIYILDKNDSKIPFDFENFQQYALREEQQMKQEEEMRRMMENRGENYNPIIKDQSPRPGSMPLAA